MAFQMLPNLDEQLHSAIENGNLTLVSQYLSSGIGLNRLILSTNHRESMTILSAAAYENQDKIVKYLVTQLKAPINFQDSLSMRSALHWACLGDSYSCAQILIESGANVNACDRDKVTPIIQASTIGSIKIVQLLVNSGAQVNAMDRFHWSSLHYAAFHGRDKLTQILVRAGCIANNPTIFSQGTPLSNLIRNKCTFDTIQLLLEAGYDLSMDNWILQYEKYAGLAVAFPDLASYLKYKFTNPPMLSHLCRNKIRTFFNGVLVEKKISLLQIPHFIKGFLLLQTEHVLSN